MKHLLRILILLMVTLASPLAWAGAAESPFSTFRSFKTLLTPGVETVLDVKADPVEATYVLKFGEDFRPAEAERLGIELEAVPGYRSHRWVTQRDVSVSFRSPMVRIGVMQWKKGKRAVVIGVMRNTGFLPRYFAGPNGCKKLLPTNLERARPLYDGACDGMRPDLREARDRGTSLAEEELLEILRLQMRSGWNIDTTRLRDYVDRSETDRVVVFGLLQLAMAHTISLEHEATLGVLEEIQAFVDDQPGAINDAQQTMVRRIGEATFLRLIEANLESQGFAALAHWERYHRWAGPDFAPGLKLRLAELYRRALAPEKAAGLYLDVIALGPPNEVELLVQLALTYREAKDLVRSAATTAYVRERYPNAYLPEALRGLRETPL